MLWRPQSFLVTDYYFAKRKARSTLCPTSTVLFLVAEAPGWLCYLCRNAECRKRHSVRYMFPAIVTFSSSTGRNHDCQLNSVTVLRADGWPCSCEKCWNARYWYHAHSLGADDCYSTRFLYITTAHMTSQVITMFSVIMRSGEPFSTWRRNCTIYHAQCYTVHKYPPMYPLLNKVGTWWTWFLLALELNTIIVCKAGVYTAVTSAFKKENFGAVDSLS